MIRCSNGDGKVCCDVDNKDSTATCCQDDSNLFALAGDWGPFRTIDESAVSSTRIMEPSPSTAATGSARASAAEATAANADSGDSGGSLQTGAIVGIAIGGITGAGALGALAFWRVRKSKRKQVVPGASELDGYEMRHEMKAEESAAHEISGREVPIELSSGDERHEMEGSSPLDQKLAKGRRDQAKP